MKKVGEFKNTKDINIELNGRNVYGLELQNYKSKKALIKLSVIKDIFIMKDNDIFNESYPTFLLEKDKDMEDYMLIPYSTDLEEFKDSLNKFKELSTDLNSEIDIESISIEKYFNEYTKKKNQSILNLDNGYMSVGIDSVISNDFSKIHIFENDKCLVFVPNFLYLLIDKFDEEKFINEEYNIDGNGLLLFNNNKQFNQSYNSELVKNAIKDILS